MAKILIVDDDPIQLNILENLLTGEGHRIMRAESGFEAEKMLAASPPDLLLTDIIMPGMDGLETIMRLRKSCSSFLPVIAMSSNADYLTMAQRLGAHGALLKPFKAKQILALLRDFI